MPAWPTDHVARYLLTLPTERLSWEKAPALTALLRSGVTWRVDAARRILERSIATQTTEGHLNYNEVQHYGAGHALTIKTQTLTASLVHPLVLLYEIDGEQRYLEAARRQVEASLKTPRTRDGGLTSRLEAIELWVDWIYMLCPSLARLGAVTGDRGLVDEAFTQFAVHVDHLVDPKAGLARHAWAQTPNHYPQSTFWSRGNGWLGVGGVELLEIAPEHPRASVVRAAIIRLAEAITPLQDASGFWRHVLDDPDERFETSGTLMHACWLAKAAGLGLIDRSHIQAARRAVDVVTGLVGEDGAVHGVAVPPGGPGVPYGTTAYGQGFYLQAVLTLDQLAGS